MVLQDAAGNILPTHSVSAGLDYPSIGPRACRAGGTRPHRSTPGIDDSAALEDSSGIAEREGILPALGVLSTRWPWIQRTLHTLAPGHDCGAGIWQGRGDQDVETGASSRAASTRPGQADERTGHVFASLARIGSSRSGDVRHGGDPTLALVGRSRGARSIAPAPT
jgi:hypothetical protein